MKNYLLEIFNFNLMKLHEHIHAGIHADYTRDSASALLFVVMILVHITSTFFDRGALTQQR